MITADRAAAGARIAYSSAPRPRTRTRAWAAARAALGAGDLAIGDHVAEIGRDLHPERDGQPDRVDVVQNMEDTREPGRPGDPDRSAEREARTDQDEQSVLGGVAFEMREGTEKSLELH